MQLRGIFEFQISTSVLVNRNVQNTLHTDRSGTIAAARVQALLRDHGEFLPCKHSLELQESETRIQTKV